MVEQFEGALAAEQCRELVVLHDRLIAASAARGYPRSPATYGFRDDLTPGAQAKVLPALQACVEHIGAVPADGTRAMFVESLLLTSMEAGDSLPAHADNAVRDAVGRWVPGEYRQRCLTALIYLSEQFDGGELVFDQWGLTITPRQGLLVVFPSDQHHVHQVKPVRSGRRHVLSMWFTVHRWHALLAQRITTRWPR